MLMAKSTPFLMGIEVMGDYLDFQRLHGAIRSLADRHEIVLERDNNTKVSDVRKISNGDLDALDAKEMLIGLSFDIHTLLQGFRRTQPLENGVHDVLKANKTTALYSETEMDQIIERYGNGNLYYSLKIPFVDVMGYLLVFSEMLTIGGFPVCHRKEKMAESFWVDSAAGMEDQAYIALFTTCLGNALRESLGEACYRETQRLKKKRRWIPDYRFRYIELLNAFYLTKCRDLSNSEKAGVLYALLRLLLRCSKDDAVKGVSRAEHIALLPDYTGFPRFMQVFANASEDGEVYMDQIFGEINRRDLIW